MIARGDTRGYTADIDSEAGSRRPKPDIIPRSFVLRLTEGVGNNEVVEERP